MGKEVRPGEEKKKTKIITRQASNGGEGENLSSDVVP